MIKRKYYTMNRAALRFRPKSRSVLKYIMAASITNTMRKNRGVLAKDVMRMLGGGKAREMINRTV